MNTAGGRGTVGTPTGPDTDCDGIDQNCVNGPDDGYVSTRAPNPLHFVLLLCARGVVGLGAARRRVRVRSGA